MLSNILFDDILNIVCKPLAVSGECDELMGQNQCKPGLVVFTELHSALVELFTGSLIAEWPEPQSLDSVTLS